MSNRVRWWNNISLLAGLLALLLEFVYGLPGALKERLTTLSRLVLAAFAQALLRALGLALVAAIIWEMTYLIYL